MVRLHHRGFPYLANGYRIPRHVHAHARSSSISSGRDHRRQRLHQMPVDGALQFPRSIFRASPLLQEKAAAFFRHVNFKPSLGKTRVGCAPEVPGSG